MYVALSIPYTVALVCNVALGTEIIFQGSCQ